MGLAFTYEAAGEPSKAQQELKRALEIHEEIESTWGKAVVIQDLLLNTLYFYTDERDQRERIAAEVERFWQATEHGVTLLPPRFGLLSLLFLYGEWDEARRLAEPFLEDEYVVQALIYPVLAHIARYQGRSDDAWRISAYLFPEGPDTPTRSVIMSYAIPTQHAAIDLALDDEDFELAERWMAANAHWLGPDGEPDACVIWRSQLAARRGRLALLKHDLQRAVEYAAEAVALARDPYQPIALVEALLLAGQCQRVRGQTEAAADAWHAALELARACDAAYLEADTALRLARLDAERGQGELARKRSTRALATIERLGARLLLRGLEPAGVSGETELAGLAGGVHITPRELEIARLLVTGKSNREMAEQLSISVRTIERHISNLYEKTGAHGRAAITAYVLSNNLV
jgi:DNA-binding CsgD family transcriptional regulator